MGDTGESEPDFILKRFRRLNELRTNLYQNQDYKSIDDLL